MDKSPTKNNSKKNIEAISQQLKEESTAELSLFDNIKVPISTKSINFRNNTYQDIAKKMGSTYHLSDLNEITNARSMNDKNPKNDLEKNDSFEYDWD